MKNILTQKTRISVIVVTSIFLSVSGEAVTTFGQEEDTFSKIWSHPSQTFQTKNLEMKKQSENPFKKKETTLTLHSKKGLSIKETLDLLHHEDLIGSRLH